MFRPFFFLLLLAFAAADYNDLCSEDSQCQENESCHTKCGPCEGSCLGRPGMNYCPKKCNFGCLCNPGFYRDRFTKKCVRYESCSRPDEKCYDPNEQYDRCGNHCEDKCPELIWKFPTRCVPFCRAPACACKPGLKRHPTNGKCVAESQCPIMDKRP